MSLKGDKYETAEEVKFRLENTIVMYDGDPVFINRVSMTEAEDRKEIARVFFLPMPLKGKMREEEVRKYLSSKKFDLSPFRMGYMNHKGRATFVARSPLRQNRQGLSQGVTTFTDCYGARDELMDFITMSRSQGFVDMVKGKYPDFKDCGEMLDNKETTSVALSRSFAFIIDHDLEALFLLHKGVKCGMSMRGDKALKVPPKFHFLREEMEEHKIPLV